MHKEDASTVEYYSAIKKNEIGSFAEIWMDLETVTQSEVSQKEKNKYRTYVESEKRYRWTFLQTVNRDTDIETRRVDSGWGKAGGMNKEIRIYYGHYHV